jgi:hypothetical protein
MAANISKELEISAITFNPAGVNPATGLSALFNDPKKFYDNIGKTSWDKIDSYIAPTDILTLGQTAAFPVVRTDGRTNVEYMPTLSANSVLPAHGLGNFIDKYYPNLQPIPTIYNTQRKRGKNVQK